MCFSIVDRNVDKTLFIGLLMTIVNQSDLEKETNDSHNTSYSNTIYYKEKENAFIKKIISVVYFLLPLLQNEGDI